MDSGNPEYITMQIMNKNFIFYKKMEYRMKLPHSQH